MDTKATIKSKFYNNKFETDYKDNITFKVASNKLLLPTPCSAEHYIPENIARMIEFNIIRFNPLAKSVFATVN